MSNTRLRNTKCKWHDDGWEEPKGTCGSWTLNVEEASLMTHGMGTLHIPWSWCKARPESQRARCQSHQRGSRSARAIFKVLAGSLDKCLLGIFWTSLSLGYQTGLQKQCPKECLWYRCVAMIHLEPTKRWVRIKPYDSHEPSILRRIDSFTLINLVQYLSSNDILRSRSNPTAL